ncbi:MAG TPA: hypothetical protein DHW15_10595 [Bacteroidetes bacterium]|nr:MAG: hypothetical protein ABR95_10940 [Sphingobacteriales bacterium BACL12 MAG-120813-bin55]HCK22583.1 hypothetical protein [Bacteroidota bacterium]
MYTYLPCHLMLKNVCCMFLDVRFTADNASSNSYQLIRRQAPIIYKINGGRVEESVKENYYLWRIIPI